jgi:hypothetical protein
MMDTLSAKNRANLAGQMDMFSMLDDTAAPAPAFVYPEIRPYTLREMLMLEKEASGMFFSGQLLDDYSKCVEALNPMSIAEIAPSEEAVESDTSALPDRARVKIAGVISGVTLKTTKKEERMAFFTVEDSGGVIECLAFPKTFIQYGEIIKADHAVFVEGNLSVREEESPKILVSVMGLLVDNAHFSETPKPTEKPKTETPSVRTEQKPSPMSPDSRAQTGQKAYHPYESMEPAKGAYNPYESMTPAKGAYNPYETMTPTRAYNPYEAMPTPSSPKPPAAEQAPRTSPAPRPPPPQKPYPRVPDREGGVYRKALNLCEIFCDGTTAVILYDMKEGKYFAGDLRVRATPFVLARLEGIVGKENVVVR